MSKKLSDDDRALFRQAVQGTTPLDPLNRDLSSKAPKKRSISFKKRENSPEITLTHAHSAHPATVGPLTPLSFARNGVSSRQLSDLKRGKHPIQASLDLHGHTLAEAETALSALLTRSLGRGDRCIHVVHGKGLTRGSETPILKNFINQQLRNIAEVLAFCSAEPKEGGTGAVTILLKRIN